MPAFAYRVKEESLINHRDWSISKTCCFNMFNNFFHYCTDGVLYVASFGTYEETKLWADAINKTNLKDHASFELKAHRHNTGEKNNPFTGHRSIGTQYGQYISLERLNKDQLNYWSIKFKEGTPQNLIFAVTKLIFKNITYGERAKGSDHHKHMIDLVKEGATAYEAMIYSKYFLHISYEYPVPNQCWTSLKRAVKLMDDGPSFRDFGKGRFELYVSHAPAREESEVNGLTSYRHQDFQQKVRGVFEYIPLRVFRERFAPFRKQEA